ncbi:uncharacterized protein LOC143474168 isoform X2 [Brachyhypopomus gauderio]|uniref:uncharacterized protein LOC143474168 isoform X2 n=1 Tax=Brachyhypopomus gauderio TaxID=698409 RepID=UPI0040420D91
MESVLMAAALHILCLCQGLQGATDSSHRTEPVTNGKPAFKHSGSSSLNLSAACSGTLMTLHRGRWVALSFKHLSTEDIRPLAQQVCENLGCGGFFNLTDNGTAPTNSCLSDCIIRNSTVHHCTVDPLSNCMHTADVVCEHQAIRLAAGNDSCAGRVEVWHAGQWGSVCDDDWDWRGGNVVCMQLRCGTAVKVMSGAVGFGPGRGPIHISSLNCTGTESNLWQCSTQTTNRTDLCGHKEDAGVVCSGNVTGTTMKPTELNNTNWTTESQSNATVTAHGGRISTLTLICVGLSSVLLLLLISNIGTCKYYRGKQNAFVIYQRQSNSNSYTTVGIQTLELDNSNSLPTPAAVDVRRYSQDDSSDTSSDFDYHQYYQCNVQSPAAVNFPSDAAVVAECSQAHETICTDGNAPQNTTNCDVDSDSTSSWEFDKNTQPEREKLLNKAIDNAAVVGECSQAQERICTEGNAPKSTRSCDFDLESTSSGECYENPPLEEAKLEIPALDNAAVVGECSQAQERICTEGNAPKSTRSCDFDLESTSSGECYENPPLEEAKLEIPEDSTDSGSTSSGECYANIADVTNLLETLEQSPSLHVQPLLNHHTPQPTGNNSLVHPSSPNQDNSSTSSGETYENVDNESGFGAQQLNQSSSDSDYDDVANW